MKLEVGKRYTIKDTYKKPDKKYFRGVPNISASTLRGRTLKCRKLSATGMSAWFNYQGEDFWVKSTYLKQAPNLPKTKKTLRVKSNQFYMPKMKGKSFLITKPEYVTSASAFWVPGMNQYIGQVTTVVEEGPSKWVRVHADNGGYMWNKDWLKPAHKVGKGTPTMKVRKLSLQEELMAIDARYDAKIRNIKYRSNARQNEMARKAQDYKEYLARDKTKVNVDKYLTSLKSKATYKVVKLGWRSKLRKYGLPVLALSAAVGGIAYGALTLL